MTWEWAFVFAVAILSGTVIFISVITIDHKNREITADDELSELQEAVKRIVAVQNTITADMVAIRATHDKVDKQVEETKSLLSKSNLAVGLQRRGVGA
jgi:septal ring factor EnvC (AmiA/AmiB activator)